MSESTWDGICSSIGKPFVKCQCYLKKLTQCFFILILSFEYPRDLVQERDAASSPPLLPEELVWCILDGLQVMWCFQLKQISQTWKFTLMNKHTICSQHFRRKEECTYGKEVIVASCIWEMLTNHSRSLSTYQLDLFGEFSWLSCGLCSVLASGFLPRWSTWNCLRVPITKHSTRFSSSIPILKKGLRVNALTELLLINY